MITAGTRCCGKCGRWFFGYSCPYCNKEKYAKLFDKAEDFLKEYA